MIEKVNCYKIFLDNNPNMIAYLKSFMGYLEQNGFNKEIRIFVYDKTILSELKYH